MHIMPNKIKDNRDFRNERMDKRDQVVMTRAGALAITSIPNNEGPSALLNLVIIHNIHIV